MPLRFFYIFLNLFFINLSLKGYALTEKKSTSSFDLCCDAVIAESASPGIQFNSLGRALSIAPPSIIPTQADRTELSPLVMGDNLPDVLDGYDTLEEESSTNNVGMLQYFKPDNVSTDETSMPALIREDTPLREEIVQAPMVENVKPSEVTPQKPIILEPLNAASELQKALDDIAIKREFLRSTILPLERQIIKKRYTAPKTTTEHTNDFLSLLLDVLGVNEED